MINSNNNQNTRRLFGVAVVIALALVAAGYLVGEGIQNIRSYERFVTVKGLAERNVTADRAVWPITFD